MALHKMPQASRYCPTCPPAPQVRKRTRCPSYACAWSCAECWCDGEGRLESRPCSTQRDLIAADPPDHSGARDLDERTVIGAHVFCRGVGLAEVPHSAVIHDPGAAVRSHPYVGGSVEPAKAIHERLLEGGVVGKPHGLQRERLARRAEVDEIDLVPHLRSGRGGLRRREAEVALERVERGSRPKRTSDERVRHELDSGERRIGGLDGQRRGDRLEWEREDIRDRDILLLDQGETRRREHARRI